MKHAAKPPTPLDEASSITDPMLPDAERAELQRQGAKSAARGEPSGANPLSRARNQPSATGESADTWSQRNAAWEKGHQAQSAAGRKKKGA